MSKVGVVVPCYNVKNHIEGVLKRMPALVTNIFVVDDACPEKSGQFVQQNIKDPRVEVLFHLTNQGVGGAVMTGYRAALKEGCTYIVKLDGDGQMDPLLIPRFVRPLEKGLSDYTKGNRFLLPRSLKNMPFLRLIGNSLLSFFAKASTGYWNVMDPHNGFTAIHSSALKLLPFEKIEKRYFFEVDVLYRLGEIRAKVDDVPMDSFYGEEKSSLSIGQVTLTFPIKYLRCFYKRILNNYFIRDFNIGSLHLVSGSVLLCFGALFGAYHWIRNSTLLRGTPAGTVMLSAFPALVGIQLITAALSYDISITPRTPLHPFVDETP